MSSVRAFAEGLMGYLRGVVSDERDEATDGTAQFARERAAWESERERLRAIEADRQITEWKREGRLRASERVEGLARLILRHGSADVVGFDGESVPLRVLFGQFLQENGAVVPMGERMGVDRVALSGTGGANARLAAMAQARMKAEGVGFGAALAQVSAAHPELAREAREE